MTKKAYDFLEEGAATYRERNAVYGDNYMRVGGAMAALFPDGVTLKTADDHNRFHIFMLKIVKLSRYCVNWDKGGHEDSLLDDMVYGGILLEIDDGIRNRPQHIDPRDPEFQPTIRMTQDEMQKLYELAVANGGHPVGIVVESIEDTFFVHDRMSDDGCPNTPYSAHEVHGYGVRPGTLHILTGEQHAPYHQADEGRHEQGGYQARLHQAGHRAGGSSCPVDGAAL